MPEDEVIYDEADWPLSAEGARISFAERQKLPDSSFCYVAVVDGKKVRKFPAHDAAHVRNGLARLPQSDLSPAAKSKTFACLKRRASRFGIKVSSAKSAQGADVLVQREAIRDDVPQDGLFWTVGTKVGGAAFAADGRIVTFTREGLENCHKTWLGKPVFLNHDKEGEAAVKGSIKDLIYADPYVYFGLEVSADVKKDEAVGSSIDIQEMVLSEENGILAFDGQGISLVFSPKHPVCDILDGAEDCGKNIGIAAKEAVEPPVEAKPAEAATEVKEQEGKCMCDGKTKELEAAVAAKDATIAEKDAAVIAKDKELAEVKTALDAYKAKEAEAAKAARTKMEEDLKALGRDPAKLSKLDNEAFAAVLEEIKATAEAAKKPVGGTAQGAGLPAETDKKTEYEEYRKKWEAKYGKPRYQ